LSLIPQVIEGIDRWERQTGSGRRYPDCVDDLTVEVVQGVASSVVERMQAFDTGAKKIVDKLPHNFENIGLIKFLFPRARVISVRRDPRDIAISNYFADYAAKTGGMGFAYDLREIGEQLADHNLLMHHWQALFGEDILEVQYEAVVEDLESSARKMLDFLGLDWDPTVIDFASVERPIKTASVWQVRQPLYATSVARWERYLPWLGPLFAGTNAKIQAKPVTDMINLPTPGWLTQGVAHFKAGQLDDCEMCVKKLLHHIPEHAAAKFMVGLVYVAKGHVLDGIDYLEQAVGQIPTQVAWKTDLLKAYEIAGIEDKAEQLRDQVALQAQKTDPGHLIGQEDAQSRGIL
ncbi:MAG: sulfotransferase, partial [Pseudomonadota bacterium]